jgi:hypothetical protein
MTDDSGIQSRITSLIDEEHERLQALEVELDQCWDLLRQRRAKREFGADPDEAQVRDPGTVETYLS